MFSTLSITVEKHYCGDHLVDIALFTSAETCGMEAPKSQDALSNKSCCKDVVDLIEGQDELSLSSYEDLQLVKITLLATTVLPIEIHDTRVLKVFEPKGYYSPPLIIRDFNILHEVFLI